MTPTLQDVAYLLGLPIVGEAVGLRVVAASWKDDLEGRFALVHLVEEAGPINLHPRSAGSSKTWFLQFTVRIHSIYKFNCYNSHVPLTYSTACTTFNGSILRRKLNAVCYVGVRLLGLP